MDFKRAGEGVGHWRGLLTVRLRYGKARPTLRANSQNSHFFERSNRHMVKPEWGTKRSCPKCATRFYDLGKDDPVTCIACGTAWEPEPILKSKQPLPFDAPKPELIKKDDDLVGEDEDIDTGEDEEPSPDDEVDLGGDDDLGVETPTDEDEH